MYRPVDGSEVQIEGFSVIVHVDDDIETKLREVNDKLSDVFLGESAHKTVRLLTNGKRTTFFAETGNEDVLFEQITNHIKKEVTGQRFPIRFEFQNFLAYTKPTVLE